MKESRSTAKESGSYYTPDILADFMIYHLFEDESEYKFGKNISILEPSSGDGIFFDALFQNETFRNRFKLPAKVNVYAVEKNEKALSKSQEKTHIYMEKPNSILYFKQDFLEYHAKNKRKFDIFIGNPPYIKSMYLSEKQIKQCELIHRAVGLSPKKIKNIWTSFLIAGAQSLNEDGVLCLVLPAELLQVIYAKELRDYLKREFKRMEIFSFNELVFDDIEQDVIILFCARNQRPGVSFYHVNTKEELKKPSYVRDHANISRETLDKWTNYILPDNDLKFLDRLKLKNKLLPVKQYCVAQVGIVTAANDYFIVDKSVIGEPELSKLSKPMLKNGSQLISTLRFTKADLARLQKSGKPSFFLDFKDKDQAFFSEPAKAYLLKGEERLIHRSYKSKLRDNWYHISSVWVSEGFFTKRSNIFPKMVINDARSLVTDSFYRVQMRDDYKIQDLVFSFYNTLTFVFAELEGRYYGGSVLELTPNEYKNLPIPYCKNIPKDKLEKLDKMLRGGARIEEILNYTDKVILQEGYKMADRDISRLRKIYAQLVNRRLKKNYLAIKRSYNTNS